MKTALLKLLKFSSVIALVFTAVDVNTFTCFLLYHQPQIPKTAEKLMVK